MEPAPAAALAAPAPPAARPPGPPLWCGRYRPTGQGSGDCTAHPGADRLPGRAQACAEAPAEPASTHVAPVHLGLDPRAGGDLGVAAGCVAPVRAEAGDPADRLPPARRLKGPR